VTQADQHSRRARARQGAREEALVERIAQRALDLYVSGRISTRPDVATWRRIMVAVEPRTRRWSLARQERARRAAYRELTWLRLERDPLDVLRGHGHTALYGRREEALAIIGGDRDYVMTLVRAYDRLAAGSWSLSGLVLSQAVIEELLRVAARPRG